MLNRPRRLKLLLSIMYLKDSHNDEENAYIWIELVISHLIEIYLFARTI
jgi:hypothetical protein